MGCNYLSLPEIPASGYKVLTYMLFLWTWELLTHWLLRDVEVMWRVYFSNSFCDWYHKHFREIGVHWMPHDQQQAITRTNVHSLSPEKPYGLTRPNWVYFIKVMLISISKLGHHWFRYHVSQNKSSTRIILFYLYIKMSVKYAFAWSLWQLFQFSQLCVLFEMSGLKNLCSERISYDDIDLVLCHCLRY